MPKSNLAKKIEKNMYECGRLITNSKKLIRSARKDVRYLERHIEDGALVPLLPLVEESFRIISSIYVNNPGTKYQQ